MTAINTSLGHIALKKPLVLASGILGTNAAIMRRCIDDGCGAVTMKSIGPVERLGHQNPTVIDFGAGMINAVGLPTPGYLNMDEEWKELAHQIKEPIIASIYGSSVEDYCNIIKYINKFNPTIIELNVSCPNKKAGMSFGKSCDLVAELVSEAKKCTKIPIMPKLTPNCDNIAEIAKACEKAGADMISAINTVGPGMIIDIETARPVLAYGTGGVSGPAIKPIAIKCVYDIYDAVKIPILGMGGISNGEDAIEMMMAGASAVGVGTAVYYDGTKVFDKINKEIIDWMLKHDIKSLKEIIGKAHAGKTNG
jgi:dihydroorotate dehydrogenase (NAD+) catalytic subunit